MDLQPVDYVLGSLMIVLAVMGLFRGLSGTLAFVAAIIAAGAMAVFGWPLSETWFAAVWQRGAVTLVATLLTFGLVRLLVKRSVNGLLAQPSDAIFGCFVGMIAGLLLIVAWAYSGFCIEYSTLATEVARYVR